MKQSYLYSKQAKAVRLMCIVMDAVNSGRLPNSRGWRLLDWICKRYEIPYPEAHYLQVDVINGFLKA
jgi:hypothetical protein